MLCSKILFYFSSCSLILNTKSLSLQREIFSRNNRKIPEVINKLKINNDNIFKYSPDLTVLNENFVFTINNTTTFNKEKYNSLYKKIKSCKKYISRDTEIDNSFEILQDKKSVLSNTLCEFNIRFFPKNMKIKMVSKYLFDENFEIIQQDIEYVEINDKKVNILTLLNEYLNITNKKSIIGFLTFVLIKRTK